MIIIDSKSQATPIIAALSVEYIFFVGVKIRVAKIRLSFPLLAAKSSFAYSNNLSFAETPPEIQSVLAPYSRPALISFLAKTSTTAS